MKKKNGCRILLGGLGGDSHSVGLHILHRALVDNGYLVDFLGTQNALEDFMTRAAGFDVVMISNMDGHAEHYLKDFHTPATAPGRRRTFWYLGGNLTIGDADGYQAHFERLGFDRVFVKFVDLSTVLALLAEDLREVEPVLSSRRNGGWPTSCFSPSARMSLPVGPRARRRHPWRTTRLSSQDSRASLSCLPRSRPASGLP